MLTCLVLRNLNQYNNKNDNMKENERVKHVDIILGHSCNNNCRHCIRKDPFFKATKKNKSFSEIKKDLDYFRKKKYNMVVFTGGEPTIRKDILAIISYAKRIGYKYIQLQTNGRMLAYNRFTEKLIDAGTNRFAVSIHSHNQVIHDAQTKVDGSWKQSIEGIRNLKKHDVFIYVQFVITKPNYRHLIKIQKLISNLGVNNIQYAFVFPMGGAHSDFDGIVPKFSDVMPYIREAVNYSKQNNINCVITGIPYCLAPELMNKMLEKDQVRADKLFLNQFVDWIKFRKDNMKVKSPQCEFCKLYDKCEGLWSEYVKRYGYDEIKPIRNSS